MMVKHILALSLSVCTMGAASAAEQKLAYGATPVFGQVVGFGFPASFVKGHEQSDGRQYILELIPKGQSVEKWSEMVTLTGVKGTAGKVDPKEFLGRMASSFKQECPDRFNALWLGESKVSGHLAIGALISCGSTKKVKHSETAMVYAIVGKEDIYTVQWAERVDGGGVLTDDQASIEKWAQRMEILSPLRVCDRVAGEKPPYESCVGKGM